MAKKKNKGRRQHQDRALTPQEIPTETLRAMAEQIDLPPSQATYESLRLQMQYSGPIPPPFMMDAFDRVVPGAADRILTMAEQQSKHRRDIERRVVGGNIRNETLGTIAALMVSLVVIGVGGYLAATDKALAGFGLIIGDLVILAGVFVYGRSRSVRQLVDKGADTE